MKKRKSERCENSEKLQLWFKKFEKCEARLFMTPFEPRWWAYWIQIDNWNLHKIYDQRISYLPH